jgi:GNAT superfamily N-acetyltransferase
MDSARSGVAIRSASDADADALASLSTQLGYPCGAAAMRTRLERVRERNAGAVFVAEDSQWRVVGWTHVVERFHLEDEPFVELAGLVVDESVRSTGIGAALLRAVESWAREQGHDRLRVRSNVVRERAHRFYAREGYAERKRQVVFDKPLTKF